MQRREALASLLFLTNSHRWQFNGQDSQRLTDGRKFRVIDIKFEIDGKHVYADNIDDVLNLESINMIANGVRESLASVRDPDTSEFPTVVVRGNLMDALAFPLKDQRRLLQ